MGKRQAISAGPQAGSSVSRRRAGEGGMIWYQTMSCRTDAAMNETFKTGRVLCRYRYDALDRIAVVDPEAQDVVSRFYQKNRLTVEIQGAVRRRVFHGEDRLLAEYKTEGSSVRADLLGTDMQGSVLEAVSGQERQSLAYNPYGHRAPGGPFSGFNGERADPVTGHYLLGNGYRAFNPVLMRFNSPDSLSPFGRGGLNAYAYCQGDPINRSDPGGHISSFRVPGLIMFPEKKFAFQRLPNEMVERIINYLPSTDLVALSKTSRTMGEKISGLLRVPRIDTDDPSALLTIQRNLKRGTGVPRNDALYREHVKAHIDHAAKSTDLRLSAEIASVDDDVQVFLNEVTGLQRARYADFKAKVDSGRKLYATSPDVLENIERVEHKLRELNKELNVLTRQRRNMQHLAVSIRSRL
ncbi:YD repeat-containing protein [Pseudomonas cannabina]|uniref:YD repeat-containing protein n=4 Tax=Pseudomonas syringae group TaxID=136849 RepID=A0A3M3R263_PSECA|nr:YD repeat-containing protein [Pseudomonas syringae pv. maculicola]RMN90629.1 YD repeat-containing protein [Pseudomonas cannabina]